MRFLRRWSFISLILVTLIAVAGPSAFRTDHTQEVAAPFSSPLWLGGNAAPTTTLQLDRQKTGLDMEWTYDKPEQFSIKGKVGFPETPESAFLVWITPSGEVDLQELGNMQNTINLDAR